MPNKFPILKAPQLVFSIIVNVADPQELVAIALCYRRTFNLVKRHRKKSEELHLRMNSTLLETIILFQGIEYFIFHSVFTFERFFDDPLEISEKVRIGDINATMSLSKTDEGYWNVMWDNDRAQGFRVLMGWISELFRIDIALLSFNSLTLWSLDWVQKRQFGSKVAGFHGGYYSVTEDQYRYIMDNCNAQVLALKTSPPETFRYHGKLERFNSLMVSEPCFWITLDHLLTMDLQELWFYQSNLTIIDLNKFVKHWLAGGSPRLKILCFDMESLNFGEAFQGIEKYVHRGPKGDRDYVRFNGVMTVVPGELSIVRDDGVVATVTDDDDIFFMVVWPDSANNFY